MIADYWDPPKDPTQTYEVAQAIRTYALCGATHLSEAEKIPSEGLFYAVPWNLEWHYFCVRFNEFPLKNKLDHASFWAHVVSKTVATLYRLKHKDICTLWQNFSHGEVANENGYKIRMSPKFPSPLEHSEELASQFSLQNLSIDVERCVPFKHPYSFYHSLVGVVTYDKKPN